MNEEMICIVNSMGKMKRSESFDKLDRIKRGGTLDNKSIPKQMDDSYKNEIYGKNKASEYIHKLQEQIQLMDSTKAQEIQQAKDLIKAKQAEKIGKIKREYAKLIDKDPNHEQTHILQRDIDIEKVCEEFERREEQEIDMINQKYTYKKQKTQEIIDQNNILDSFSLSDKEM